MTKIDLFIYIGSELLSFLQTPLGILIFGGLSAWAGSILYLDKNNKLTRVDKWYSEMKSETQKLDSLSLAIANLMHRLDDINCYREFEKWGTEYMLTIKHISLMVLDNKISDTQLQHLVYFILQNVCDGKKTSIEKLWDYFIYYAKIHDNCIIEYKPEEYKCINEAYQICKKLRKLK